MKNIIPAILACTLLGLSSFAFGKSFSYVETYIPANLYTEASSTSVNKLAVISDSDGTIYRIDSGQSLKAKLVIPPGVDIFSASIQVSKWKTSSTTGEFLYAKSMTDFSEVEDYNATFSTSFPFQFVNTSFDDSDVPIAVVSNDTTTSEQTGYMIFDNTTSDDALLIKTISIQFTVNSSMINTYNAWVQSTGSSLPVTLNLDGGGTATDGTGTGSGSSGSTVDFNDPNSIEGCSPLLGNCGTSTGGTSTDGSSTDGSSTDGSSTDGSSTDGSSTDGSSTDGSSTDGSSSDGSSTDGSSTDGSSTSSTGTTETDGEDTGTYEQINHNSSDQYYLWDSIADDSVTSSSGTRHIRVRIESDQFDDISTQLDDLADENLTPTSTQNRDMIEVNTASGSVTLYPYAEDPDGLVEIIEQLFPNDSAGITRKGVVYVIIDGSLLFGYLDYYVTKPDTAPTNGAFAFSAIEVEDGLQVMTITYPSGVTQKMYFYSSVMPTISN